MSRVMVTGVNGFVGQHLSHELASQGVAVVGVGHSSERSEKLEGSLETYVSCDLTDSDEVAKLPVDDVDAIVNLAGLASAGDSFAKSDLYKHVNVAVMAVLCERLIKDGHKTRMVAISTGALYDSSQPLPLKEDSKTTTQGSPYAMSKLLMEESAQKYRAAGLDLVIARPFNHIGPGQKPGFLLPDLYAKIQGALKTDGALKVGDLETKRDYTDVRDVAKAYGKLALAATLQHDIYNVCSGQSVAGKQLLELLLMELGNPSLKTVIDERLIRPNDPKDLYGSNARLRTEIGWQPTTPLQQTIKDFVAAV